MNFRVAPILPTSFGSHGDLPVLTKRTIWYFQFSSIFPQALSKKQADLSKLEQMIDVSRTFSTHSSSSTISNDEQHKYYQMQINNDEQTGSITWYDIVEQEIWIQQFLRNVADWYACRTYRMIYQGMILSTGMFGVISCFCLLMM